MDWDDLRFSLPAFLTITVMPMTYSIANGVVAGLVAHFILNVFSVSLIALFTGPPRRQVSNKLLSDPLVLQHVRRAASGFRRLVGELHAHLAHRRVFILCQITVHEQAKASKK